MLNWILRLFLSVSAISFFAVIYFISNFVIDQPWNLGGASILLKLVVGLSLLAVPFLLAAGSLLLCKKLGIDDDETDAIKSIEPANNDYLPHYLAFFFVALTISNWIMFLVVFGLILVFTFNSRTSYFNPIFLIYRYNFYYVARNDSARILVISKIQLKRIEDFSNYKRRLYRINDYTFIEG